MMHPKNAPVSAWSRGQLKLEVASMLSRPEYILMTDVEKRAFGYPTTEQEMRDFIMATRKID